MESFCGIDPSAMRLHPHLSFGGQCEAAFRFYERCLGGRVTTMLTWGASPMAMEVKPAMRDKICHATMELGSGVLMGSDAEAEMYEAPRGFSVLLEIGEVEDAERVFAALAEGGRVQMALQKTFWAERFGVVVDRFGVPWEINCAG
jgi:PhnB protein